MIKSGNDGRKQSALARPFANVALSKFNLILRKAAGLSRRMRGMLTVRGPSFEAPLRFAPQDEAVLKESHPSNRDDKPSSSAKPTDAASQASPNA